MAFSAATELLFYDLVLFCLIRERGEVFMSGIGKEEIVIMIH